MKIAFSTSGDSLNAPLDQRFGRACRFLIYDQESGRLDSVTNKPNLNAAQGAGIQAASLLAKHDIDCVITGHCGPKAFRILEAAGIRVYTCNAESVADAYQILKDGTLKPSESANVEGHWV